MPTVRSQFAQLLAPGLNKVMFDWQKDHPEEYPQFYGEIDTKPGEAWHDTQMTAAFGLLQQMTEGKPTLLDDPIQGGTHRIYINSYGLGWQASWEALQDERYGIFKKMAAQLMRSARLTTESVAIAPLNLAGTTTTTIDGVSLINTAHPLLGGGTYSNKLATFADISVTSLQDLLNLYEGTVDDRGLLVKIVPTKLWIPYQLQWRAQQVLQTALEPFSGNNTVNVMQGRLQPCVLHYLTSAQNYFISSDSYNHMTMKWSVKPQSTMSDDPNTGGMRHYIRMRLGVGIPEFRGWAGAMV